MVGVSTGVNQVANLVTLARLDVPGAGGVGGGSRMHVCTRGTLRWAKPWCSCQGWGEGSAYYQFKGIFTPLQPESGRGSKAARIPKSRSSHQTACDVGSWFALRPTAPGFCLSSLDMNWAMH
jgi:hypothetical protein